MNNIEKVHEHIMFILKSTFIVYLLILIIGCIPMGHTEQIPDTLQDKSDRLESILENTTDAVLHQVPTKFTAFHEKWYFLIFVAIIGGLLGAIIIIIYNHLQQKKESRALILTISIEFIYAFNRCVINYEQACNREVSLSGLFSFLDASIFSRFVKVNPEPDVIEAIMELKAKYFQIQPHVEEASKYAALARRFPERGKEGKEEDYYKTARHAQETSLTYFLEVYDEIVENTAIILNAAKKTITGRVVENLEKKFIESKEKKKKIESPPMSP